MTQLTGGGGPWGRPVDRSHGQHVEERRRLLDAATVTLVAFIGMAASGVGLHDSFVAWGRDQVAGVVVGVTGIVAVAAAVAYSLPGTRPYSRLTLLVALGSGALALLTLIGAQLVQLSTAGAMSPYLPVLWLALLAFLGVPLVRNVRIAIRQGLQRPGAIPLKLVGLGSLLAFFPISQFVYSSSIAPLLQRPSLSVGVELVSVIRSANHLAITANVKLHNGGPRVLVINSVYWGSAFAVVDSPSPVLDLQPQFHEVAPGWTAHTTTSSGRLFQGGNLFPPQLELDSGQDLSRYVTLFLRGQSSYDLAQLSLQLVIARGDILALGNTSAEPDVCTRRQGAVGNDVVDEEVVTPQSWLEQVLAPGRLVLISSVPQTVARDTSADYSRPPQLRAAIMEASGAQCLDRTSSLKDRYGLRTVAVATDLPLWPPSGTGKSAT